MTLQRFQLLLVALRCEEQGFITVINSLNLSSRRRKLHFVLLERDLSLGHVPIKLNQLALLGFLVPQELSLSLCE